MTPQQERLTKGGPLSLYRDIAVGKEASALEFLRYELYTTLLSGLPGLLGLGSRAALYPTLFKSCGRRLAIGKGVTLRNPGKIDIGSRVLLDDFSVLDARGDGATVSIADHVIIGRFSSLVAKGAQIRLGAGVNVGSYCRLATQSRLFIGESTLIAAYCYIGPGNHQGGGDAPLIARDMEIKGGVEIGEHCWIGAHATVLDGVRVGARSIVGAHSLVREDVPPGVVVAGCPARVIGPAN